MVLPLPAKKVNFGDQAFSPEFMDSLFKMIRGKKKPFLGLLLAESGTRHLLLFILQSDPYAASLVEDESTRSLSLHDFFTALNGMNRPAMSLYGADPVLMKCLLVFSQKTPTTQATTALIDIEALLRQLQADPEDTVLALKKGKDVNLFYFSKGKLEELYFANPGGGLMEGSLEDQFLMNAFSGSKEAPIGVLVYKDISALPAEDADVSWDELSTGLTDYFLRPRPELIVVKGGETIDRRLLKKHRYTIGRGESNDLILNDPAASREHAVLEEKGDKFYIEDRKSKNGTLLNGQRVVTQALSDGDKIQIGEYRILFVTKTNPDVMKAETPLAELDTTMILSDLQILPREPHEPVRPKLLVLEIVNGDQAGKRFELSKKMILGRSKADIALQDVKVSRQHASIEETTGGYLYRDLNSTNGSYINDAFIQSKLLTPGDIIRVGETMIRVAEKSR